eukprot:8077579-Pyramimonas_sp.AAC.1
MADCYYRVVFKFEQPKFMLFGICNHGVFDMGVIRNVCWPLRDKRMECDCCTDEYFTDVWVERLLGADVVAKRAWRSLCGLLTILKISSIKCEHQHLLGQELRSQKRRGRAPTAATLSKLTYAKAARKEAAIVLRQVTDKHLPTPMHRR